MGVGDAFFCRGGLGSAKLRGAPADGCIPRPGLPVSFGGPGAGGESGRCPHKRPRETPRRLPPSLRPPRPLPSAPAPPHSNPAGPSGVSSVPAAAARGNGRGAGAAGKGGAPPARATRGARPVLRRLPRRPRGAWLVVLSPPRMTPVPRLSFLSAPLGRPLPSRLRRFRPREGAGDSGLHPLLAVTLTPHDSEGLGVRCPQNLRREQGSGGCGGGR